MHQNALKTEKYVDVDTQINDVFLCGYGHILSPLTEGIAGIISNVLK